MKEVLHSLGELLSHALLITAFVFVMMLLVEYLNAATRGAWQRRLSANRRGQYPLAGLLGATPGCLGAFACVTLHIHRMLTPGALVACMIATSGDESFVMLAVMPKKALLLFGILFVLGVVGGAVTDLVAGKRFLGVPVAADPAGGDEHCEELVVHDGQVYRLFPRPKELLRTWRHVSAARAAMTVGLGLFLAAVASRQLGVGHEHDALLGPFRTAIWVTLMAVTGVGLFIVATANEHFLREHLWNHVVRQHLPKMFLWVAGALALLAWVEHARIDQWVEAHESSVFLLLLAACLVGLIPQSGPHMIFVLGFAKGWVPFSVLLAGSIVQDGHGMLPLLAHSRRDFVMVKSVKFVIGLAIGLACLLAGW
jgi:hypothetical protein